MEIIINSQNPKQLVRINDIFVLPEKFIAQGGYANVYKVRMQDGTAAAFKRMFISGDKESLRLAMNEIKIMEKIRKHKNVVNLFTSQILKQKEGYEINILMEFCGGNDED
jgi:serine/threonine protein kinase